MDRRQFTTRSLAAAAGALLHNRSSNAAKQLSVIPIPGTIPDSVIEQARFPDGFL
jgi:beta-glucosidase